MRFGSGSTYPKPSSSLLRSTPPARRIVARPGSTYSSRSASGSNRSTTSAGTRQLLIECRWVVIVRTGHRELSLTDHRALRKRRISVSVESHAVITCRRPWSDASRSTTIVRKRPERVGPMTQRLSSTRGFGFYIQTR